MSSKAVSVLLQIEIPVLNHFIRGASTGEPLAVVGLENSLFAIPITQIIEVKAVSERGERLHIRTATLRKWREDFARQLRTLGVAANAREWAVRGKSRSS
jgi:hypothetical protein